MQQLAVVYEIDCMTNQANYVEKTGKKQGTRIYEYWYAIN